MPRRVARSTPLVLALVASVLAVSTAACDSSTSEPPGSPGSGYRAAAGGGVCCEPGPNPCGSESGWSPGGWAPTGGECAARVRHTWDGRFEAVLDGHGCPALEDRTWSTLPASICCGCPPDGGVPASDGGR